MATISPISTLDINGLEGKLKNTAGIHDVEICDLPFHDKEKNIPTG